MWFQSMVINVVDTTSIPGKDKYKRWGYTAGILFLIFILTANAILFILFLFTFAIAARKFNDYKKSISELKL